jgi:hypothetical protein
VRQHKQTKLPAEARDESALGAGVSVVTDGSDERLLALGLVLLAVTAVAAAVAVLRRRTA